MDLEDLFPSKPGDPLVELARQDLDPMSVDELNERIEALKVEIARVETHMNRAAAHRSAAEELLRRADRTRLSARSSQYLGKSLPSALDCHGRTYDIPSKARGLSPRVRSTQLNA